MSPEKSILSLHGIQYGGSKYTEKGTKTKTFSITKKKDDSNNSNNIIITIAIIILRHCVKSVCIFPYLDWIQRDIMYLSVFNPNVGSYRPEKLRIQRLLTQWVLARIINIPD